MNPTATLTLSRESLGLSETLVATVRVEAPTPLAVVVSKEILSANSADLWRVRASGDAQVKLLPGNRSEWIQTYLLEPYVPGESVPVEFAVLKVKVGAGNEQTLEIPAKTVAVVTSIRNAKATDARPITGQEEPPVPPPSVRSTTPYAFVGVATAIALTTAIVHRIRRSRRTVPLPSYREQLDAMANRDEGAMAAELAALLRNWTEAKYAVPVEHLTTAELCAVVPNESLRTILEWCDAIKFAGRTASPDDRQAMLETARSMIAPPSTP